MPIIRRDINELRYNAIWLLPKDGNPNYYKMLFKNAKAFFYGMEQDQLIEELDIMIKEKIERPMGASINWVLNVYKNLPTHNSFTRSKNPIYDNMNIYKETLSNWLDEVEAWVFQKVIELEHEIRFTTPARQYI